jgi:hypothetical protein
MRYSGVDWSSDLNDGPYPPWLPFSSLSRVCLGPPQNPRAMEDDSISHLWSSPEHHHIEERVTSSRTRRPRWAVEGGAAAASAAKATRIRPDGLGSGGGPVCYRRRWIGGGVAAGSSGACWWGCDAARIEDSDNDMERWTLTTATK